MAQDQLARLAVEVALAAALERSPYSTNAYIPWDLVDRIRAEIERRGGDWKSIHRTTTKREQSRD